MKLISKVVSLLQAWTLNLTCQTSPICLALFAAGPEADGSRPRSLLPLQVQKALSVVFSDRRQLHQLALQRALAKPRLARGCPQPPDAGARGATAASRRRAAIRQRASSHRAGSRARSASAAPSHPPRSLPRQVLPVFAPTLQLLQDLRKQNLEDLMCCRRSRLQHPLDLHPDLPRDLSFGVPFAPPHLQPHHRLHRPLRRQ
mmetsp:Transcript_20318/g.44074  ORF Transcript_20318/g.44074 Transcript_20318/m.44074 type:complete len:202 (-) Transcript_20318:94-699(-)